MPVNSRDRTERIIRDRECGEITGLSRTARWRLERGGKFPKKIWLTPNACGYRLSEVLAWVAARPTGRGVPADSVRVSSMAKARAAKRGRAPAWAGA